MVEAQKVRVEQALTKTLNEIDLSHLRRIQANMHRCAIACCEGGKTNAREDVQNCVETCQIPLNKAHYLVQEEIRVFQERLQRCVMECNDTVRERMQAEAGREDVNKHTRDFEACATQCVSLHTGRLPAVLKRMKEVLSKPEYNPELRG